MVLPLLALLAGAAGTAGAAGAGAAAAGAGAAGAAGAGATAAGGTASLGSLALENLAASTPATATGMGSSLPNLAATQAPAASGGAALPTIPTELAQTQQMWDAAPDAMRAATEKEKAQTSSAAQAMSAVRPSMPQAPAVSGSQLGGGRKIQRSR